MKKKILLCAALASLGVSAAVISGCAFFAGGNNDEDEHIHDYSYAYDYDENSHWEECECGEKFVEEHLLGSYDTINGLYTYCSNCGYEKYTKYSPVECGRHNYVYNRTTIEPTCTTPGETEFKCTRCDDIKTQYEDATYHDYEETWTWNGYESAKVTLICKNDNSHVVENLVAKVEYTHIEPDCFKEGADIYEASVYYYDMYRTDEKKIVIPQIGHHAYVDEYTFDREEHWHAPTCWHKDEIKDVGAHTFVGSVCSTCKYEKGSSPNLTFTLNEDGMSYDVGNDRVNNKDKFVVIPSTHNGLPVTTMGRWCFSNNDILSIVIPASVTDIHSEAIYRCNRLVEVYNLTGNGRSFGALKVHTSLEEESIIKVKGDFVFATDEVNNKEYLIDYWGEDTHVVLPSNNNSPYEIHDYCFYGLRKIECIELSDSVTAIGSSAFYWCGVDTLVVSQSTTCINRNVINSSSLKNVYYKGTQQQWAEIDISTYDNDFTRVNLYYYSATAPETEGNFWCFEEDGQTIKVW